MSAYRDVAGALVRLQAAGVRRDIADEEVARHDRELKAALERLETEINEGAARLQPPAPVSHQEVTR